MFRGEVVRHGEVPLARREAAVLEVASKQGHRVGALTQLDHLKFGGCPRKTLDRQNQNFIYKSTVFLVPVLASCCDCFEDSLQAMCSFLVNGLKSETENPRSETIAMSNKGGKSPYLAMFSELCQVDLTISVGVTDRTRKREGTEVEYVYLHALGACQAFRI
jgi:hypothetical protein